MSLNHGKISNPDKKVPVYTEQEMQDALYQIVAPIWDLLTDEVKQKLGIKANYIGDFYNKIKK